MKKIIILFSIILILTSCWNNNIENTTKQNKMIEKNYIQIPVDEFTKEIKNPENILLDIRTPQELPMFGKIRENQLLINYNDLNFPTEISKLDKNKKYLVYCWHWNRSRWAVEYMKKQGFTDVVDLKWWIDEWVIQWGNIIKW